MKLLDLSAQRHRLGHRLEEAISRVLNHGQFIMGPEVYQLEQRLCEFTGARQAVTCSSGTDALLLPLMALEVGPGDAVVVPAFTFPATAEVVKLLSATPVLADVQHDTALLDPSSAEEAINHSRRIGLRPRALIAVDLYGQPAEYVRLAAVADRAGVTLIADAAQSFGASLDGQRVGTLATFTATSFFPAKPLGCYGDGGAVLCTDDRVAALMRSLRAHGKGDHKYDIDRVGINGRLDTLQAAVLLEKLDIFEDELSARRAIAARYDRAIDRRARILNRSGSDSSYAQYVIRVDDRDAVATALAEASIPTAVHYPAPLHKQRAYADAPRVASLDASEHLARRVLSLPLHPYLTTTDTDAVLDALRAIDLFSPVPERTR